MAFGPIVVSDLVVIRVKFYSDALIIMQHLRSRKITAHWTEVGSISIGPTLVPQI
jgi:hypothetical protein